MAKVKFFVIQVIHVDTKLNIMDELHQISFNNIGYFTHDG